MPEEKRPLKVFLCHSSHDKSVVRELYGRLRAEGWIDPWLDEEKLYPGQDWDLEIEKAVESADAVVVCLSNNSVNKEGYLQRELRFVLRISDYKPEGTVFVVPVRLDSCNIPRRLEMWQYVDYFPEERKNWAYQRLLGSLNARAKKLEIATIDYVAEERARREKEKQDLEAAEKVALEKVEREAADQLEHAATQTLKPSMSSVSGGEVTRTKDIDTLTKLLNTFNVHALDDYLKNCLYRNFEVIWYWDDFIKQISTISFFIYDKNLLTHINKFHQTWENVMSYSDYFFPTYRGDRFKFEVNKDKTSENAYEKYSKDEIPAMYRALQDLVIFIREKYTEIDIEVTSKLAHESCSAEIKSGLPLKPERKYPKNIPDEVLVDQKIPKKPSDTKSRETDLGKPPRKLKTEYIIAIIGAAATILAALIGILPQIIKPAPAPTAPIATALSVTSTPLLPSATIASVNKTPIATFTVLSPSKTPEPNLTPTENIKATPVISNDSQKIYFVSANKLNVLDISSEQVDPIDTAIDSYSFLFWFSDSEVAYWSGDNLNVVNVKTGANKLFRIPRYSHVLQPSQVSEISIGRKFLFFGAIDMQDTVYSNSIDIDGTFGSTFEMSTVDVQRSTINCMRWNPSGSKVAFTVSKTMRNSTQLDLPMLVILGYGFNSQPIIVKHEVGGCISWSPDGKYIAYGNGDFPDKAYFEDQGHQFIEGIHYIEILSGKIIKLTGTKGYYPIWSPDGKTIAFLTSEGILLIDVETKDEKQIYRGNVSAILWGK